MKTLNISITDQEFRKFGLKTDKISFTKFVELVGQIISRQTLNRSVELAEKHGLSKMKMAEITKEVNVVRKSAKSRN